MKGLLQEGKHEAKKIKQGLWCTVAHLFCIKCVLASTCIIAHL